MLNKGVTVSTCCLQTGHLGWLESLTDRKRHGLLSVHDITKDNSRLCTLPAHKMTAVCADGLNQVTGVHSQTDVAEWALTGGVSIRHVTQEGALVLVEAVVSDCQQVWSLCTSWYKCVHSQHYHTSYWGSGGSNLQSQHSSWVSPPNCSLDLTGLAGSQTVPACVSPTERPAPVPVLTIELSVAVEKDQDQYKQATQPQPWDYLKQIYDHSKQLTQET